MLLYYRGASFNLKLSKLVNSPLKQGIAGEVWIQIYDNGKKKFQEKFSTAILEIQQKAGLKYIILENKIIALR